MILNVTIEPTDPIEMHQRYEEAFFDTKGGMEPIQISGEFRFDQNFFEIEQQHKSRKYGSGRTTRFKMLLVHGIQKEKK